MSAITKLPVQTQEKSVAALMTDTMPNIFTRPKAAHKSYHQFMTQATIY